MWSTSKSEAAKRFAPILEKETSKTSGMEWLRYTETIEQVTALISGFGLSSEQAEEMKRKMSEETSKQLSRDSVCMIKALDVRRGEWCTLSLIEKFEDRLILDWAHWSGCEIGKTIHFDFVNSFWNDDYHKGCDKVFYATN